MQSYVNLLRECSYLEFISMLIFEHERRRANFIDQIQPVVLCLRNHLGYEWCGFISPWYCPRHNNKLNVKEYSNLDFSKSSTDQGK